MKKLIAGLYLLSLLFISCEDDSLNNSEVNINNEFAGNWLVREKSKMVGERNFEVNIEKEPSEFNKIKIWNFYALGNSDYVFANILLLLE